VGPAASTTAVVEDIDGAPPEGVLSVGPAASTTEVEDDIDGGLPGGGTVGWTNSVHHRT
jgi:hypothetical protein